VPAAPSRCRAPSPSRQRQLLEEFAKASGEDVNHPMSKGFVDKLKQMFG
jgi:hypothetical protein